MRWGDALILLLYIGLATTIVLHQNSAADINAAGNQGSHLLATAITGKN